MTYPDGSRRDAAAAVANWKNGSAHSPITSVSTASTATGLAISASPAPRAGPGWRPSTSGVQNAPFQIFVIEKMVRSPTTSATATMTQAPASRPALIRISLAQKPESGGKPASENAGTKNRTASHGCARYSPPMSLRSNEPTRRSASPATRNRLALTTMWWTM